MGYILPLCVSKGDMFPQQKALIYNLLFFPRGAQSGCIILYSFILISQHPYEPSNLLESSGMGMSLLHFQVQPGGSILVQGAAIYLSPSLLGTAEGNQEDWKEV